MSDDEGPKQTTKRLKIDESSESEAIIRKTAKRKQRRKRAKARWRYKRYLKTTGKITEELCESVKLFDVKDMELTPSVSTLTLPAEVSEWQKQDQIAYWKSRAISLEIENRMLHKHIRDVYAKQIEDYHLMSQWTPVDTDSNDTPKRNHAVNSGKLKTVGEVPEKVIPKPPDGKNRAGEMSKIYGENSQKIMGMETAIQLNYERHIENSNPSYWPNLPLNLRH